MSKVALVSGCMLDIPCKYNGESAVQRLREEIIQKLDLTIVPICPEQLGGLPTPRVPAEILGGDGIDVINGRARVITSDGQDVTDAFLRGAEQVLHIAKITGASMAIMKKRSPSCSNCGIYDGTFTRTPLDGMGVTTAMLHEKSDVAILNLDDVHEMAKNYPLPAELAPSDPGSLVRTRVQLALVQMLARYKSQATWEIRQQESAAILDRLLKMDVPREEMEKAVRSEFSQLLPLITAQVSDSDTVRFYREALRRAMSFDILATDRHCRICSYPEGFLDTYLDAEGICTACRTYQQNQPLLENFDYLRDTLKRAIEETRGQSKYDAVIAFSGGKDSVYLLTRLTKYYNARVLCVMDDLNQQTEQALRNAHRAMSDTGSTLHIIPPMPNERDIRRNFLSNGETFCRLCLRSHFARVYQVAVEERIPYVFFGLSPHQFLDCPNAIEWSLNAIKDVSTPASLRDSAEIAKRYQHRTFQGGFDRGFIRPNEKDLLQTWMGVFEQARADFAPLVVPFFLFDSYPGEAKVMEVIAREVGWERPEVFLLGRTNCRWLRPAGLMHRAVFQYHLNYKERAAELRFGGKLMTEKEARNRFVELNRPNPDELIDREEFSQFLADDFTMSISDLPAQMQERLNRLF